MTTETHHGVPLKLWNRTRREVTRILAHVAKRAGVPICCVALDWERKVIRMGPTVTADEDDAAAGIARIRSYYADVRGYNPEWET